jgi:Cu(I)/Ag(I) efflux system membrane fusion protein
LLYWDIPESEIDRIERTGEVRRTMAITSPASGFVVEKAVLPGQRIMAGDAILKLADLGVVWVEGQVFEQDLASVRAGQTVGVTIDAFPSEEWVGRVAYVYPTLDAESRTTRVRVALSNSGLRLKPGMYATLHISGTARAAIVSVPRSAVLSTGRRNLVFVRRPDGMLEPRDVAVGFTTDDRVEIRQGLAAGETVVASATFLIDAESNLGAVLGGMANMPGMDMPGMERDQPKPAMPASPATRAAPPRDPPAPPDPHAAHRR